MPSGASVAEPGSILDEESGRTFHNHSTGRYFFPNDPAEQDRLDLQHRLVTLLLDGQLHRAPVVSPKNVLDVATGTGIWAIQFASLHPESNVVGTDLSLIQPDNAPPNVSFVKENSEKDEWIFPEPFDFIFLRLVFTCFDDPRVVIRKAFENLQPGGWIEFNDTGFELLSTDGTVDGTNNERWVELMLRAGEAVGRDFLISQKYQQWLVEAGFVDVVEEVVPCPMNNWPSDPRFHMLGKWQMTNADRAIRGTSWKLFRALGMSPEEIEDIVQRTKKDIRNTSIHGFIPWYFVYGRKPFPGEVVGNRAGKQ
ncbi:S-adenosyl-L-methionine-dependent methyltransferase [Cryphonectria parasitica EP155]|uniref:S-adenosyl-L-methionine-dependent methyltransferase n=1 Tax=Cryphonectria parasitica (strain ATCC 38755 / EP155) TaxID=660469 RepID=A0A9P4Y4K3_CRYP1|nr:S-adenosyl-L-methionine-dependent methyltransferase [Cryphonectria parasitica EP155]KAF3766531.1 S-adenosyl-L-methionine-dependent methyltransferase [Cryphonectria parasitica EP155]